MKSIKFVLTVILVISFSFIAKANNDPKNDKIATASVISKTVQKLLKEPDFILERDFSITLEFRVNKKNEIVVLSVDTDYNEKVIADYIKSRLNYKKLGEKIKSKTYILSVKMVRIS